LRGRVYSKQTLTTVVFMIVECTGSLKIIVTQSTGGESDADSINSTHINEGQESQETAALRLTDGEEDSCLWQMRCNGTHLAERIRVVLSAEG
jgi:hypothetical protein